MSRDTARLLAAVVLRALGATLLLATVLLPAADHHALARLSLGALAASADPHDLLLHHHWRYRRRPVAPVPVALRQASRDVRAVQAFQAPPLVIAPSPATYDATFGGAPVMDAAALALATAAAAWLLGLARPVVPASRALAVPSPPPRPALVAA
jgi:hypothetical protein